MQRLTLTLLLGFLAAGAALLAPGTAWTGTSRFAAQDQPAAESQPAPDARSGIEGKILLSPVCPVEHNPPLPQCAPRPYQATVIVKTPDGATEVTRFTSSSDGQFSVALDPGNYLLVPVNGKPYPRGASQTVRVKPDKFTTVTITYDTGMR